MQAMWKQVWKKWTVDKPAAFGDLLWEVLVVQYVPVHPGLMLMGDLLAYIDIFSMIFLLSILSRFSTVLFVVKQAAAGALPLVHSMLARLQRLDARHRREGGTPTRRRPVQRARDEDDEPAFACSLAWA